MSLATPKITMSFCHLRLFVASTELGIYYDHFRPREASVFLAITSSDLAA